MNDKNKNIDNNNNKYKNNKNINKKNYKKEQYELASKLIPKNELLLQNWGLCLQRMGKKKEGLKKM